MSPREREYYGDLVIIVDGSAAGPGDGLRIQGADSVNVNTLEFSGFSGNGIVIAHSSNIEVALNSTNNGDNGVAIVQSQSVRFGYGIVGGNGTNGFYVSTSNDIEIANTAIGGTYDVAMGNGANGIHLQDVKRAQGAFNVIRNNAHAGIVTTGACERINFEFNRFGENGLLAIDRGGDGVTAADTPVFESVTYNRGWLRLKGHVRSKPNSRVRLLLYTVTEPDPSGYGEGADVIINLNFEAMHVNTDANGNASFAYTFSGDNKRGATISATATVVTETFGYGDMSEFGRNVQVVDDEVEFTVTNSADSGAGSLRSAIEQGNESQCELMWPCQIAFRIAELPPPGGVFTIRPRSPLPALRHSHLWLDGGTQRKYFGDSNPAGPEIEINGSECGQCNGLEVRPGETKVESLLVRELTINGFSGDGIRVEGPGDLTNTATAYIDGCFIGTDSTGTRAVPNGGSGIRVVDAFALVGSLPYYFERRTTANLISGNAGDGIRSELGGFVSSKFNYIGTDVSGLYPIPNGENGVRTDTGGEVRGSTIAFNRGRGVLVTQPSHPNFVFSNSIHSNGSMGIDLVTDTPAQNAPEILSASAEREETRVLFKLDSPPLRGCCAAYLVNIYAGSFADGSGQGEGKELVFSALYEGGEPSLDTVIEKNLAGKFLSATAMKFERWLVTGLATSSEFSRAVQVTAPGCPTTAPTLLGAYRWSAVPGMQTYTVWAMKPGDMPRPMFTGTATEAALQLETGTEWWVEARFENCYGTQSEHRVTN